MKINYVCSYIRLYLSHFKIQRLKVTTFIFWLSDRTLSLWTKTDGSGKKTALCDVTEDWYRVSPRLVTLPLVRCWPLFLILYWKCAERATKHPFQQEIVFLLEECKQRAMKLVTHFQVAEHNLCVWALLTNKLLIMQLFSAVVLKRLRRGAVGQRKVQSGLIGAKEPSRVNVARVSAQSYGTWLCLHCLWFMRALTISISPSQ